MSLKIVETHFIHSFFLCFKIKRKTCLRAFLWSISGMNILKLDDKEIFYSPSNSVALHLLETCWTLSIHLPHNDKRNQLMNDAAVHALTLLASASRREMSNVLDQSVIRLRNKIRSTQFLDGPHNNRKWLLYVWHLKKVFYNWHFFPFSTGIFVTYTKMYSYWYIEDFSVEIRWQFLQTMARWSELTHHKFLTYKSYCLYLWFKINLILLAHLKTQSQAKLYFFVCITILTYWNVKLSHYTTRAWYMCSQGSIILMIFLPNCTFLVCFSGISGQVWSSHGLYVETRWAWCAAKANQKRLH